MSDDYPGIRTAGNLYGMAVGTDNTVWFAEQHAEKFAKIDNTGKITEVDVPGRGAGMIRLRRSGVDAEGNIWTGEYGGVGKLAMLDVGTGKVTDYATPTKYSGGYSVDVDRARNVIWMNELLGDQIARFDPRTKTFVEFRIPSPNGSVRRISVDQSRPNRVWYSSPAKNTVGFLDVTQ